MVTSRSIADCLRKPDWRFGLISGDAVCFYSAPDTQIFLNYQKDYTKPLKYTCASLVVPEIWVTHENAFFIFHDFLNELLSVIALCELFPDEHFMFIVVFYYVHTPSSNKYSDKGIVSSPTLLRNSEKSIEADP